MSEVIHALLEREGVPFATEDVAKLVASFESALAQLGFEDRNNPATTQVANLIILLAKGGQRDPSLLAERPKNHRSLLYGQRPERQGEC